MLLKVNSHVASASESPTFHEHVQFSISLIVYFFGTSQFLQHPSQRPDSRNPFPLCSDYRVLSSLPASAPFFLLASFSWHFDFFPRDFDMAFHDKFSDVSFCYCALNIFCLTRI